jgi:hypothetical protein
VRESGRWSGDKWGSGSSIYRAERGGEGHLWWWGKPGGGVLLRLAELGGEAACGCASAH